MITAYAARGAKQPLEEFTYEETLGPKDVLIKITHCGICHSDVHLIDGEWGDVYPLVPGHEIIGTVEKTGDCVQLLKEGQRVGLGWQCNSCGSCEWCSAGEEVLCSKNQATCMGHFGGFADKVVANERFAIPIPERLNSAETAPLLCGGVTVFTPLKEYARAGSRVAVVGIGGLGHLALQFAKAMGCRVTALSRTREKESAARRFGADDFIVGPPGENRFDVILNTAHTSLTMEPYLAALRPKGVFVQLGASSVPMSVSGLQLITGYKKVAGSAIGHPRVLREMLSFATENGVQAEVETMPMKNVNEGVARTRQGLARYRVVLER